MKDKTHYLSLASVISAFAVVIFHTNGCFWFYSTQDYWMQANVIQYLLRFAVPVFFMISGATLIDYHKRYDTKTYLIKRVHKTVIPFFIWSGIACIYRVWNGTYTISFSFDGIMELFLDIVNSELFLIYWFFIAIFGVYLCIPLFAAIDETRREQVFTYLILISLVINYIIPFVCKVFGLNYKQGMLFEVADHYLIYVLIGYLISKKNVPFAMRVLTYALAIGAFLIQFLGTYDLSAKMGYTVELFEGYTSLPCLLYAVGVFIFIKEIGLHIKNERVIKGIYILSNYTFPIYLLHFFVIDFIDYFVVDTYSLTYRLLAPVLNIVICMILTVIIRKIPIVRRILP